MARHARRLIVWTTGVLLSLAVLAMLGIAVLAWGIDPDMFRGRIERAATDALGRRVELTGPLRWRPGMNLQVESLGGRIANAGGFGPEPLASWQALRLGVAVRPLLDRKLVIDHIELQGLRLNLVRGADAVNWALPATTASRSDSALALAVGSIGLRDAAIRFTDLPAGRTWLARELALDVKLPARLDAPSLVFSGISLRARLEGAPLDAAGVAVQVKAPRIQVQRAPVQVGISDWTLEWNDAQLAGAMQLDAGGPTSATGRVRVEAPSLRRLLQSVSFAAPATRDATVLGALVLATDFALSGNTASLAKLELELDSTRLQGGLTLPSLSPPAIRFELAADRVDLDRYLTPEDEPGTPLSLPLAGLKALDARGVLTIRRATLAGAAAREMRIDVD